MQRLAEPAQAAVTDYADDGRWLWMHRRDEGHGPACRCLPCSDYRHHLARRMSRSFVELPDWRTPPATTAAPGSGGTTR